MTTLKEKLIQKALLSRQSRLQKNNQIPVFEVEKQAISDELCSFECYEQYKELAQQKAIMDKLSIKNPFFIVHDGVAGANSKIAGKSFINFSSYNYLGLNGDKRVIEAAKKAIDQYGTSASASRIVSGERAIHLQLERALADLYGVDDSILFVSGHATNVSTIGYLFGTDDLILHDDLIHDSVRQGIKLSGAFKLSFPHNNWQVLDSILTARRSEFKRVLIVIEGIYSMDGDYPDLPKFIDVKKRHKAFLMVDEAHSLGVMGASGKGIAEYFNIDNKLVDIWMGTLSKTLASCGGYIAGSKALVEHLKIAAPGFLYSVGMSPPLAGAALESIMIMLNEPEKIALLNQNALYFLNEAKKYGLDTGLSQGLNIVPIICGSSIKAIKLSNYLYNKQINVQPIVYPAVPERQARLRFFISAEHTREQIDLTLKHLVDFG